MNNSDKITTINKVLADYFGKHPGTTVMAKDMMNDFIEAGVFPSDNKNGLPIRKLLRELDDANNLHLIPYVHVERKALNRNWYFCDTSIAIHPKSPQGNSNSHAKVTGNAATRHKNDEGLKKYRDEDYVIDLCDEVLNLKASRQYRFDFLVGDTGMPLPTDAYYVEYNLVVEYRERQHTESIGFWNKMTTSGVLRDEQRKRYDQRRRELLPQHGIKVIEISYTDLPHNSQKRLLRDKDVDLEIIRRLISSKLNFDE
jgi:hypothetical protein